MADKRRLQGDIDRTLKRVAEGRQSFQDIMDKFQSASNQTQKEKFEADLKKEIKKLQRLRDQIKTWLTNNEIKDKRSLLEARKDIESDMERFKVIEKETKTKMYSKEGLCMEQKRDPRDKEKEEMEEWLRGKINILSEQIEKFEYDIESLVNAVKRKRGSDKEKQEAIEGKRAHLDHHKWHITKLEACMRLLNNDRLDLDVLKNVKDSVSYYIDEHDSEFIDDDLIYDELHLDDVADMSVVGALAEHNDSLRDAGDSQDEDKDEENVAVGGDNPPNATSSRSSSPPQSMSSRVSAEERSLASSTNSFEPRERHKSETEPPSTPLKLPGLPTAPLRGHSSSQSSHAPTSLPDVSKTSQNEPSNSSSQPTLLTSPTQPVPPPQPPLPSEQQAATSQPTQQQQTSRSLTGRLHTPNFPQLHIPSASSLKNDGPDSAVPPQKLDTEVETIKVSEEPPFSGISSLGLSDVVGNIPQTPVEDQVPPQLSQQHQSQLQQQLHLPNPQSGLLPLQQVSLMQQQQQQQQQQQSQQQPPQPPQMQLPVQTQQEQLQLQMVQQSQQQQQQQQQTSLQSQSAMPVNLVSGNVPFSGVTQISLAQSQSQSVASIAGLTSPSILHRGSEPPLSEPLRRQTIIGEGGQSTPNHLRVMAQQAIHAQQHQQLRLQQQQQKQSASQLMPGPPSQPQPKPTQQQQPGNIQAPPGVHRFAPGMPGVPSSFLPSHMQQQLKTSGAGNMAPPQQTLVSLAGRQADGGPDPFHPLFDAYGPIGPGGPPSNAVNPLARMMPSPSQRLTQKLTQHTQLLENAWKKLPISTDSERLRYHLARAPAIGITPNYYPQAPRSLFQSEEYYMKLDVQTLFFIFYYFEGTKAQYMAAKTLKKMSWRFHSQQLYWFQRHEEPKTIGPEFEQGAYIYFDFEQFKQKRKENFKFEYKYLEDIEM